MAKAIARKGLGVLGQRTSASPKMSGTFSMVNDTELGFLSEYPVGVESYYLPEDSARLERYADMTGCTQARLLVTVTQVGNAGSLLSIASDEITFAPEEVLAPLDATGVHVSDWCNMARTTNSVLLKWVVFNPTLAAGSFALGLCQLQVR